MTGDCSHKNLSAMYRCWNLFLPLLVCCVLVSACSAAVSTPEPTRPYLDFDPKNIPKQNLPIFTPGPSLTPSGPLLPHWSQDVATLFAYPPATVGGFPLETVEQDYTTTVVA